MGYRLPERRVENGELAAALGTSVAEIQARSGVRTRYYAADREGPSDLAKAAAKDALREAGIQAAEVEFLIFATMTPDVTFPGSGCYLQDKLGCATIGALDLRAHCAGFIFALDVAEQFLRAGAYRRILLAAGDVHSSGLDFSPRGAEVTPLFGDGAAVAVVEADGDSLLGSVVHTDATFFERFWCEFPTSRRRPGRLMPEDLPLGKYFPVIDRDAAFRDGVAQIRAAVEELLEKTRIDRREVRRFLFQHVYRDAARAAAESLGVSDRAAIGGEDTGHIASASLPLELCRARERRDVDSGDLVCLATAGAGMNSAAALLRL